MPRLPLSYKLDLSFLATRTAYTGRASRSGALCPPRRTANGKSHNGPRAPRAPISLCSAHAPVRVRPLPFATVLRRRTTSVAQPVDPSQNSLAIALQLTHHRRIPLRLAHRRRLSQSQPRQRR